MDKLIQATALSSAFSAIAMGLYGRHRQHFASDFTYNKFHFGTYLQIFAAVGLFSVRKMPFRP